MLRKLEWKYFLFSYGVPFVPAFIFLFIETESNGKVYGSAYVSMFDVIKYGEVLMNLPNLTLRFGAG